MYSQHLKTGLSGFIESNLRPVAEWSGFFNALADILFLAFENRTNLSGFRMVWQPFCFFAIPKPDTNCVQKMTIQKPDSPVFGC
jgi:hypothetical protein